MKALAAVAVAWLVCAGVSAADTSLVVVVKVSTTADAINGSVSSPAALLAHPGPDGVSLREAITAVNHEPGRHAITFAPSLAGQTIALAQSLPPLTRGNTALIGLLDTYGQPTVTLDGSGITNCCDVLSVEASGVLISHLHVTGVVDSHSAIHVSPGAAGGERDIHDVRIEQNVLDDDGRPGYGVIVGPNGSPVPVGATLGDIRIAGNVVRGFLHDGINVGLLCHQCTLQGLVIEDNTFADNLGPGEPSVELDTSYEGNKILGTQIVRNSFTGNWLGVALNGGGGLPNAPGGPAAATGNTISGTVVAQNTFEGNSDGVSLIGGISTADATGNSVVDTQITNDLFANNTPYGAISIAGGNQGASGNAVSGVEIVNDTIADNDGGLNVAESNDGAAGNQIMGVSVLNTIFWQNGAYDLGGPDISDVGLAVASSITAASAFADGNIAADPRFASAQDFHLSAGSPAIDAGAATSAPSVDIDDGRRDGAPDIGAYEYGSTARPRLEVFVDELGGAGTVASSPGGIACERACVEAFDAHTAVTLTPTPAPGYRFAGWSGACSGTATCVVDLDTSTAVTATFSFRLPTAAPKKPKAAKPS